MILKTSGNICISNYVSLNLKKSKKLCVILPDIIRYFSTIASEDTDTAKTKCSNILEYIYLYIWILCIYIIMNLIIDIQCEHACIFNVR